MCIRGATGTPVEIAINKLTTLSSQPKVKSNINFEHAVQYVINHLHEGITTDEFEAVRDNFAHITNHLGKRSAVIEYNKILDKLHEQLLSLNPPTPLLLSQPAAGVEEQKVINTEHVVEDTGWSRRNKCC